MSDLGTTPRREDAAYEVPEFDLVRKAYERPRHLCRLCGENREAWHRKPETMRSVEKLICDWCAQTWAAPFNMPGATRGDKIVVQRLKAAAERLRWEVMNGHHAART